MKKNRLVGTFAKAAALLVGALCTSTAVADSIVTYSGYTCLGATIAGSHSGPSEGAALQSVTRCPFTRIGSDDTANITGINVRVFDGSSTEAISCFAVSCGALGDACDETPPKNTGASFTGAKSFALGGLVAQVNGYAYLDCEFPTTGSAPSVMYSYRVTD